MQTKVTATLLLATAVLIAGAGCSHQATPLPATATPTQNPNLTPPSQGASQALSDPNTPPEVKKYLQEHQGQINQAATKPAGGK